MSGVQRYSVIVIGPPPIYCRVEWRPSDEGDLVFHEDHARALAEKDAEIERLKGLLRRTIDWVASEESRHAQLFAAELRAALRPADESEPL